MYLIYLPYKTPKIITKTLIQVAKEKIKKNLQLSKTALFFWDQIKKD